MTRIDTFTFRVNTDERRILAAIADHMQRSQSDALRLLIREAARDLPKDARAQVHESDAAPSNGGDNATGG